jgi:micrococcal nuclease
MRRAIASTVIALLLLGCGDDLSRSSPGPTGSPKSAYVASSQREPFHRPGCEWAQKINPDNLESFSTRDEAIRAGHRPCKVCKP